MAATLTLDPERRREFEAALVELLSRLGAADADLEQAVARAVDESVGALAESASDGSSLSPSDVLRIRAGKFAAARLPPSLYRDPARLLSLRRELARLTSALLGPEGERGSRF